MDDPGAIKGLTAFGDGFLAFKEDSIWVARYVGAPAVWEWDKIPGDTGCLANYGLVNVGDAVFFIGRDNVYAFDGVRPVPIGEDIREFLYADLDDAKLYRLMGAYDYELANVWWYYCSKSNATAIPDKCVVYNRTTGKWGKYTIDVEAAARYYTQGITYDNLGSEYATYDDLPTTISYDSPYWIADNPDLAIIKTDHTVYTLNGDAGDTSCTLFNMGDDNMFTTFQRLRPRFYTEPVSSTMEYSYDDLHGDSFTSKSTPNYNNGKYDTLHSSRWHQCKLNFTGNVEIVGVTPDLAVNGSE